MSKWSHKSIISKVIMAFGKGKGKGSSVEFQMREGKMAAAQKGALMNTEGRLWALCHPEMKDKNARKITMGMSFWDDEKWTKALPFRFVSTRYSNTKKDSVLEVQKFHYSMYFKTA
jgi:hypothetical protein